MKAIFDYIDRHIIWVLIVAILFWFAGWYVSAFPPFGLLFLLRFSIYFFRGFRCEVRAGIQLKSQSFIHKKVPKFLLFIFLIFVLGGITKIVSIFTLWTLV